MDERSLYYMLNDFKSKPFSLIIDYQGIPTLLDFHAESIRQINLSFRIDGTMFKQNGARLLGYVQINMANDSAFIHLKGDNAKYHVTPNNLKISYWNKLIQELKKLLL